MKTPKNFVLIGRSGSGKGTEADLLMDRIGNLYYISTGDLFRGLAKAETATSWRIKEVLDSGGLPFDDLATTLWMHEIAFNVKRGQGFILDGAPRRLVEAENLDRFLDFLEWKENTFHLLIDVSREEAFNRLTKRRICNECGKLIPWTGKSQDLKTCDECGGKLIIRKDDNPEAINSRLDYYEEIVTEVVDYYNGQDRLIIINGEQSIEAVYKDIIKAIAK